MAPILIKADRIIRGFRPEQLSIRHLGTRHAVAAGNNRDPGIINSLVAGRKGGSLRQSS